jgi:molybdopterin-binding protein
VFRYPNSAFVARFVGTGNVIAGTVQRTESGDQGGAFRGRFLGGNLALDVVAEREGPIHAVIRPEDIVLSLTHHPDSARNHMEGRVVRLERLGPVTLVHLDVGRPLIASVTTASADEMGLHPSVPVIVAFKATAILLV